MREVYMKKLIILIMISILLISGCSRKISNKDYVARYDELMYNFQVYINDDIFYNNQAFFDYEEFTTSFTTRTFKLSIEGFIEQIDEMLYQLGTMGPDVKDPIIQQYQSKIEYALEDIRAQLADYVELKSVTTLVSNKITLYNDTFKLMEGLSEGLIKLKKYSDKLDAHVEEARSKQHEHYKSLHDLKIKNYFRIYYTYGYLAAIMASYEEYTSLRNDPKNPAALRLGSDEYFVYELSVPVMKKVVEFSHEFLNPDSFNLDNVDKEVLSYYEALQAFKERTDSYYNVRSEMDQDFFVSDKFREYVVVKEVIKGWRNKVYKYGLDETSTDYDFKNLRLQFLNIKKMIVNEQLRQLMFNETQGRIKQETDHTMEKNED